MSSYQGDANVQTFQTDLYWSVPPDAYALGLQIANGGADTLLYVSDIDQKKAQVLALREYAARLRSEIDALFSASQGAISPTAQQALTQMVALEQANAFAESGFVTQQVPPAATVPTFRTPLVAPGIASITTPRTNFQAANLAATVANANLNTRIELLETIYSGMNEAAERAALLAPINVSTPIPADDSLVANPQEQLNNVLFPPPGYRQGAPAARLPVASSAGNSENAQAANATTAAGSALGGTRSAPMRQRMFGRARPTTAGGCGCGAVPWNAAGPLSISSPAPYAAQYGMSQVNAAQQAILDDAAETMLQSAQRMANTPGEVQRTNSANLAIGATFDPTSVAGMIALDRANMQPFLLRSGDGNALNIPTPVDQALPGAVNPYCMSADIPAYAPLGLNGPTSPFVMSSHLSRNWSSGPPMGGPGILNAWTALSTGGAALAPGCVSGSIPSRQNAAYGLESRNEFAQASSNARADANSENSASSISVSNSSSSSDAPANSRPTPTAGNNSGTNGAASRARVSESASTSQGNTTTRQTNANETRGQTQFGARDEQQAQRHVVSSPQAFLNTGQYGGLPYAVTPFGFGTNVGIAYPWGTLYNPTPSSPNDAGYVGAWQLMAADPGYLGSPSVYYLGASPVCGYQMIGPAYPFGPNAGPGATLPCPGSVKGCFAPGAPLSMPAQPAQSISLPRGSVPITHQQVSATLNRDALRFDPSARLEAASAVSAQGEVDLLNAQALSVAPVLDGGPGERMYSRRVAQNMCRACQSCGDIQ